MAILYHVIAQLQKAHSGLKVSFIFSNDEFKNRKVKELSVKFSALSFSKEGETKGKKSREENTKKISLASILQDGIIL